MSAQPQYGALPIVGVANVSAANINRDGTGTIVQIAVARPPGTRIQSVKVKAIVTTTAGMVRIFRKGNGLTFNADGTIASFAAPSWQLIEELPIAAATVSATVEGAEAEWTPTDGIDLGPYEQLGVSTHNAESMNVIARGQHL